MTSLKLVLLCVSRGVFFCCCCIYHEDYTENPKFFIELMFTEHTRITRQMLRHKIEMCSLKLFLIASMWVFVSKS